MEELDVYLDFLYENLQGYVYSPTLKRSTGDFSHDHFFHWPEQKSELKEHIRKSSETLDVYICPSVFSKKEAKRRSFKASQVVWVELDGKENIKYPKLPQPNLSVQTSSNTNRHSYWKIGVTTDHKVIDSINKRLTYYLEADTSGWDAVQLLRPPETRNWKYDGKPSVSLYSTQESLFTEKLEASVFDWLPEVETPDVKLLQSELLDPEQLLKQLPIISSLKKKIKEEIPSVGDRSQFMYKIAHELAEIGCNHSQISSLIFLVDERLDKFKGRADRLERISQLASIALSRIQADEAVSLYSIEDVLNHTDDLNWIYRKWLHDRGLLIVTGAPGVGKTQFCLQMAYAASVGDQFINAQFTKMKCLCMSLEMDVRELKFFLRKQAKGLSQLQEFSKNCRILDEHGSLLQYEEIIEEWRPNLVIVDSLLEWSDGDLKDDARVLELMRWIRRIRRKYNCAFVLIHHNRKANSTNKKPNKLEDLFGSVIINKDIDTAICLWQEEDQDFIEGLLVKSRYFMKEDLKIARDENLLFSIYENDSEESEGPGGTKDHLRFG